MTIVLRTFAGANSKYKIESNANNISESLHPDEKYLGFTQKDIHVLT